MPGECGRRRQLAPEAVDAVERTAVQAAEHAYAAYRHELDNQVLPVVSIVFGEAFQALRRAEPSSSFRAQQEYMATVADRLKI